MTKLRLEGAGGSDGMGLVAGVRRLILIYLPWASFNQGNLI